MIRGMLAEPGAMHGERARRAAAGLSAVPARASTRPQRCDGADLHLVRGGVPGQGRRSAARGAVGADRPGRARHPGTAAQEPAAAPQRGSAVLTAQVARSLLRFLHSDGRIPRELGSVVPRVARRRLAGLPARPDTATSAALLASCDRDTETGPRDYAVLLILARLGLRSSETARLSLDDIDWRNGEVTIRGKGSRSKCSRCRGTWAKR